MPPKTMRQSVFANDLLMQYDAEQDPYAEKPKRRQQASVYDRLNGTLTGTGRSQRAQKQVKGMDALNLRGGGERGEVEKKFNPRTNADWSIGEPEAPRATVDTATGKLRLLFDRYGFKGGTASRSGQAGRRDSYQDGRNLMDEAALIKCMQDCGAFDSTFTVSAARMTFSKTKLGKKSEIDFDRFQVLVQEIAKLKGTPYNEVVSSAWLQLQVGRKRNPNNNAAIQGKSTNELMQAVFFHYCQFGRTSQSSSEAMDNQQFSKFCYDAPGLICARFRGHDIDLAFNKVKNKATRQLDFTQFVSACVQIAMKLFGSDNVSNDFAMLCSDHVFLLPVILGTTNADERRRASMAIAEHNPIYEDDEDESDDEDAMFAQQFLAGDEGEFQRPKRAPPAPPGRDFVGSTLTGTQRRVAAEEELQRPKRAPPAPSGRDFMGSTLTGTQRQVMAPPAGGRPMRQAPRAPGSAPQAAEEVYEEVYEEEELETGPGEEQFDGYEDELYAEDEEEMYAEEEEAVGERGGAAAGQYGGSSRAAKPLVSSMLDDFASNYDQEKLTGTYAGSSNKKGGTYSRMADKDSYTGVYKRRADQPGVGINMASDHDQRRKNEMHAGYKGNTNTGTDGTYHSIENMVARR
jgi:hypothetical protein